MKQEVNLTIATDSNGLGGIATVLNIYKKCGFFNRLNMILIPAHSTNKSFLGLCKIKLYFFSFIKIIFYFVFYKVGLAHVHMASRGSYLRKSLLIRFIKMLGGKVILHLHGGEFKEFYSKECSKKKQKHIKRTFELVDAVIVLSTQWLSWMKEILERTEHISVIYNAVPKLKLDRSEIQPGLIAFLGRIGQPKGVLDLLWAFPKVLEACPNAELMLAGDGDIASFKKEAETLGIEKSVHFLGWVAGADKEALLAKADVYCLPSYNEGFPVGVLEAMSAGVPVVASKAGGIPDAIEDQKEGLLVDAGDIEGLSTALITMIKERQLNNDYAVAASEKFQRSFSLEATIPQLDSLYQDVLNESSQ